jgi:hypothetical protein
VQWKKYKQKVFTNVDFLKELEIKSRKTKKIKEWLILALRTLAILFLILAFAGPKFQSNNKNYTINKDKKIVYFDNSLSLGIPKNNSTLFFNQKAHLINLLEDDQEYIFFSNTETLKNIKGEKLKEYIYNNLKLSPAICRHNQNLKKASLFNSSVKNSKKVLLYFSDNQTVLDKNIDSSLIDKSLHIFVQNQSLKGIKNISLDSLIFVGKKNGNLQYELWISASDPGLQTPILIKTGNHILWSQTAKFNDSLIKKINIHLPLVNKLQAEIQINDKAFPFDNHLFFTYTQPKKNRILIIGNEIPGFLKKIYTEDEFEIIHKQVNQIDYSELGTYNLIILNKVSPNDFSAENFSNYLQKYGNIAWIPLLDSNYSPHQLKKSLAQMGFHSNSTFTIDTSKVVLNKINFTSPFFRNIFLKPTSNFNYPEIQKHIKFKKNPEWLYLLSDQTPFVQKFTSKGNLFLFSTELSSSSFTNNPYLVVPLFYQMGKWEQSYDRPYFNIGEKNTWNIEVPEENNDATIKLVKKENEIIPFQIISHKKIRISTLDMPQEAGIYALVYQKDTLDYVAFNYQRLENSLKIIKWPDSPQISSIDNFHKQLLYLNNKNRNGNTWKIFISLAFLMLLLEMLVIKLWK